ncbi:hypothetical protein BDV96DRAFT_199411 [Lophiotrema nucula]|uniref:F-box domain-containing protein n=1 Tax=Lophiotrema nucula TaxID=690887 RepID=A0A6A5YV56_9PLEO|nr:hypothetical protein BDV96DRAFT_199411 [Lophiotrema nucula]
MHDMESTSLPLEVHSIIAKFLPFSSLYDYRLVSRDFADIGAKELFSVITFHANRASVAQILNIAERDYLSKYVKSIVWDTNLWDLNLESGDFDAFKDAVVEVEMATGMDRNRDNILRSITTEHHRCYLENMREQMPYLTMLGN